MGARVDPPADSRVRSNRVTLICPSHHAKMPYNDMGM